MAQRRVPFGERARYWFDSTLARGTSALFGWMALLCLGIVVPASAVLVWTDPHAPASLPDRLARVWRLTGQTLRLGDATGTPCGWRCRCSSHSSPCCTSPRSSA